MHLGRNSSAASQLFKFGLLWVAACLCLPSMAGALLQCDVSYAGTTHKLKAKPTLDPYTVQPIDIGGRFFFKMVLTETNAKLDHVLIYAYLDQEPRPLILQQAKYKGPFPISAQPYLLTGEQHVYGGPIERELTYSCWLSTDAP